MTACGRTDFTLREFSEHGINLTLVKLVPVTIINSYKPGIVKSLALTSLLSGGKSTRSCGLYPFFSCQCALFLF